MFKYRLVFIGIMIIISIISLTIVPRYRYQECVKIGGSHWYCVMDAFS